MPSQSTQTLLLSPAELDYLHTSLSQTPPLRPDGRQATQFRPLIAETCLLPSTNGSARICWSEGEECIVGVKCEVERTSSSSGGDAGWVSLSIEVPGRRDDDALPVFLGSLLTEALVQSGFLPRRLVINRLWHWRIWIDVCFLGNNRRKSNCAVADTPSLCTTFISFTIVIVDYAPRTAGYTASTSNQRR